MFGSLHTLIQGAQILTWTLGSRSSMVGTVFSWFHSPEYRVLWLGWSFKYLYCPFNTSPFFFNLINKISWIRFIKLSIISWCHVCRLPIAEWVKNNISILLCLSKDTAVNRALSSLDEDHLKLSVQSL